MAIDPTKLAALQTLTLSGKPAVCEYLKVTWDANDSAQTKYYSTARFHETPPFTAVGVTLEARIMGDPFRSFELNPDLRTSDLDITFEDIDKAITGKFQTFGSGVRCELFYYYPDVDLTVSVWFGQLQAPKVYGWKQLNCIATNGFRSREQQIPRRMRPRECTSNFGGLLGAAEDIVTNLCPYDRHVGGTEGLLNGGVPFEDCPRMSTADCTARFGHSRYYGGFIVDASAVVTDTQNGGWLAKTQGNTSFLDEPIRVIAGYKRVRELPILLWRKEVNNNEPSKGFVSIVGEIGEGPIVSANPVWINDKAPQGLFNVQLGTRGQGKTPYAPDVSNFSGTAHFSARFGWIDAANAKPSDIVAMADVVGYAGVGVYSVAATGSGVIAEYFSDAAWTDDYSSRVEYDFRKNPRFSVPFVGMDRVFSIKSTGTIDPRYTETYTFTGTNTTTTKSKLVVNGSTVFDCTSGGADNGTIALTANTPVSIAYYITVDISEPGDSWFSSLTWQSASQTPQNVPHSRLDHASTATTGRQWSDDRVWWLLELYTNQRWGMGYPISRFTLADWADTSLWGMANVGFEVTFADGETETYNHRRTTFNAILEGRPVEEQIIDICRSGGISVPFQHESEITVTPFRVATSGELAAAKVFTDTGEDKNIVWADGQPAIKLEQTPNDKIVNEIELTFEDAATDDASRPITVNDPNQKLLAGRELGDNNLKTVPKKYTAFGTNILGEAIKIAYRSMRFGESDSGGTHNNLKVTFSVPFEIALGSRRYDIIKVQSDLITGFLSPENEQIAYWRFVKTPKTSGGPCENTAQAYNHTAYTNFETDLDADPDLHPLPSLRAIPDPPEVLTITATYDSANGNIEVTV